MSSKKSYKTEKGQGFFHVYNRGILSNIIFNDKEDYESFTNFLNSYLGPPEDRQKLHKKTFKVRGRLFKGIPHQPKNYFNKVELLAYRLTTGNFDLLVREVEAGSLENFVRSLCTRYAIYFNKKYKRTGALFEGPYKSVSIKSQQDLSNLTRYFHFDSEFSSYREYLGKRNSPWIKSELILAYFKNNNYKDFVEKYKPDKTTQNSIQPEMSDKQTTYIPTQTKTRSKVPEFLAVSIASFLLLFSLGMRNVNTARFKNIYSTQVSAVLAESEHSEEIPNSTPTLLVANPQITSELTPEFSLELTPLPTAQAVSTVEVRPGVTNVNIRKLPTTESEPIGIANGGDIFELISYDGLWYQIKLIDESIGYISSEFVSLNNQNE